MGNRLVYGNYVEGYDLSDLYKNPLKLEFVANLVNSEATTTALDKEIKIGTYQYSPTGTTVIVNDSIMEINFANIITPDQLKATSTLSIDFTFEHSKYDPTAGEPTTKTSNIDVQFSYSLPQDFSSFSELFDSIGFKEAIGTTTNIKPVYAASGDTSCDGFTLTDNINCFIPNTQTTPSGTVTKFASGIDGSGEPIKIVGNTPSSRSLQLQMPAMRYVVDPANPGASTDGFWEYYKILSVSATFSTVGVPRSLHSNRGYEVGIVYMDEFLRSSTALVSRNNTIQTTCANSATINQIQVDIPWTQRAPFWAKFYKFVIKPDQSTYETIFSETFFKDPKSNSVFFLLEGENAAKVEAGQQLIVKRDSGGAVERCTTATVIDKQVKGIEFLKILNPLDPGTETDPIYINVPAGPYMEIVPNGFNITSNEETGGNLVAFAAKTITFPRYDKTSGWPIGQARVNVPNPAKTAFVDYTIPVNSVITITIKQYRGGAGGGFLSRCESRENIYTSPELIASTNYDNFKLWFDGDNIFEYIKDNTKTDNGDGSKTDSVYNQAILTDAAITPIETVTTAQFPVANTPLSAASQTPNSVNYFQFYRGGDNSFWLLSSGPQSCRSFSSIGGHSSNVEIEITVERANSGGVVAFESVPGEALPDVWYENEKSFSVNSLGEHTSNFRNQSIQRQENALVNTGFFDCFTFGNGVESYTVRDSIKGKAFALGNRVTTTSGEEYKQAHRFADLTYSGIFNDESNVNKLNEFNLGLSNFKPLESSFASIQVIFARETDILVLQEDRISYVLAGKDLLSDAGGTGALTSVPTVLGQQIARLEEYGISRNPESFATYGENKFFTDEQRGAVIQLKGGAYNNESLTVISEEGMRGWFRDLFHSNFNSQKLGGFDPYMNEYVLSANETKLPFVGDCDLCGTSRNITLAPGAESNYCVNVTQEVGTVDIEYAFPSGGNNTLITEDGTGTLDEILFAETGSVAANGGTLVTEDSTSNNGYTITVLYNGNTFTTGEVFVNGILSIDKNSVFAETLTVIVSSNSIVTDTIEVTTNCPRADEITIIQVGITTNADTGKFIHNQYRWVDGQFESPLHTKLMEFSLGTESPILSQFQKLTGSQGAGVIPDEAATVSIISNKVDFDDYDFVANTNSFRFIRTATFYGDTQADLLSLLAASTKITPLITVDSSSGQFSSDFIMPTGNTNDNLYLIYDYRNATEIQLCFSTVDLNDVCCNCAVDVVPIPITPAPTDPGCNQYTLSVVSSSNSYEVFGRTGGGTFTFTGQQGGAVPTRTLGPNEEVSVCAQTGSIVATGDVEAIIGLPCGALFDAEFAYKGCAPGGVKGVGFTPTLAFGTPPLVVCAQNIPEALNSSAVVSAAGIACTDTFYLARVCGASQTDTLQLSAKASVGVFSVGQTVKCIITSSTPAVTTCALILETGLTSGNGGDIELRASGCDDATNCPQPEQIYGWRTQANQNSGSDININCGDAIGTLQNSIWSNVGTMGTIKQGETVFYQTEAMTQPFQGGGKFYAVREPIPPALQALPGITFDGVVQINSSGQAFTRATCP